MYDGEQKIRPEQLRELDTTEIAILLNEYRALLKSATIMEDGEAAYVLLGIENQTEVHYAMPARNMLDMSNPIFEKYAQDYKLHIISPQQIADDELEKFHSSLREVIGCIKYSRLGKCFHFTRLRRQNLLKNDKKTISACGAFILLR